MNCGAETPIRRAPSEAGPPARRVLTPPGAECDPQYQLAENTRRHQLQ
ncbi:hypothetical protein LNP74_33570 [Klebsiella pneumoniae subsp. pneumoniae]|nr:hypothetical protein [Klebsiella pneumoniae subsp. pneumoniae]